MKSPFKASASASIGKALSAVGQGDAPAFIEPRGHRVTHGMLLGAARQFARAIIETGLRPDQRVAVQMVPSADRLAILAALWSIGAVVVPLDPQLDQARRKLILQGAGPGLIVHDANIDISSPLMIRQVTTADLRRAGNDAAPGELDSWIAQGQPDHLAALVYGAGAQDSMRGVVLDHAALLAAATGLVRRYQIGLGTRLSVPLPLNHSVRLVAELVVLLSGAAFSDADDLSHLIVADRPDLAKEATGAPDFVLASGNGRTIRDLQRRFPMARVYNSYMRAELSGVAVCSDPRDPDHTAHSTSGRPLPGVEVMIVDPRSGMDMLLYEIGEIWIRGVPVMKKYHNDHAATGNARDSSGFFRTAELGYLDSEGRVVLSPEGHAQI